MKKLFVILTSGHRLAFQADEGFSLRTADAVGDFVNVIAATPEGAGMALATLNSKAVAVMIHPEAEGGTVSEVELRPADPSQQQDEEPAPAPAVSPAPAPKPAPAVKAGSDGFPELMD
jgi:hypothetical protein